MIFTGCEITCDCMALTHCPFNSRNFINFTVYYKAYYFIIYTHMFTCLDFPSISVSEERNVPQKLITNEGMYITMHDVYPR